MIGACIKFTLRYFAASFVVGFSFACILVVPALLKEFSLAGLGVLAVFSLLNTIVIAVVALFPTVIAIVVGKLINQHSLLYYAGAGGAVGFLSYLIWFWVLPLWHVEGCGPHWMRPRSWRRFQLRYSFLAAVDCLAVSHIGLSAVASPRAEPRQVASGYSCCI